MTTEPSFDPGAPLAGAADPWASAPTPELPRRAAVPHDRHDRRRTGPCEADRRATGGPPARAADLAAAIRAALAAGEPVVVTGCGTSEHGAHGRRRDPARGGACGRSRGAGAISATQAFELALAPPPTRTRDRHLARGRDAATNAALAAARDAGAQTAVITVSGGSPAGALAGIVVETGELDQGWCHTIGYLSPVVAAAAVGAHLSGRPLDAATVADLVADGTRDTAGAERIAARFADAAHLLVVASGADRPAAASSCSRSRRQPGSRPRTAISRPSCTATCRPPATGTDLVLILTDRDRRAERLARARQALAAARVIGLRSAAIVASGWMRSSTRP